MWLFRKNSTSDLWELYQDEFTRDEFEKAYKFAKCLIHKDQCLWVQIFPFTKINSLWMFSDSFIKINLLIFHSSCRMFSICNTKCFIVNISYLTCTKQVFFWLASSFLLSVLLSFVSAIRIWLFFWWRWKKKGSVI